MRSTMRNLTRIALLVLLPTSALWAQVSPNVARGFDAEKTYAFGELDAINMFNGNLNVPIPLGMKYGVGPNLSYQFVLAYGGNDWTAHTEDVMKTGPEWQPLAENFEPNNYYGWHSPSDRSNAGLGWRLTFGRLYGGIDSGCTQLDGLAGQAYGFESPDGALHCFYTSLHVNRTEEASTDTFYTRDGSYMRLSKNPDQKWQVESPDGTRYVFNLGQLEVAQISDRFDNWVKFEYTPTLWTITDSLGRGHSVSFKAGPAYAEEHSATDTIVDHLLVDVVRLDGPDGAPVDYTMAYAGESDGTWTPLKWATVEGRYLPPEMISPDARIKVPLLENIAGPSGSYAMRYETWEYAAPRSCPLSSLRVPTFGRFEWDYQSTSFPRSSGLVKDKHTHIPYENEAIAVSERRVFDRDTLVGRRTYSRTIDMNDTNGQASEEAVIVTDYGRGSGTAFDTILRKSAHYFSACVVNCVAPVNRGFYALPLTMKASSEPVPRVNSDAGGTRYLSNVEYGPGSNWTEIKRSTYVTYEADVDLGSFGNGMIGAGTDFNRRATSERTYYHDDPNGSSFHYTGSRQSDFDGLGHYRASISESSFGGPSRTTRTAYNPAAGTFGLNFSLPSISNPWLVNLFTRTEVAENSVFNVSEFDFEPATGFLRRKRTLKNTSEISPGNVPRTTKDVLVVYGHDNLGNVTSEAWYGGDTGSVEDNNLKDVTSFGTPTIQLTHKPINKAANDWKITSEYVGSPFKSADVTVNRAGLVTASRDSAGVETTYGYDPAGRIKTVQPTAAASTTYQYVDATATVPPSVTETVTYGGSTLRTNVYRYDGLGRLRRSEKSMPANKTSIVDVAYDDLGRTWKVSQPSEATPSNWTVTTYDPFGRPLLVTAPDASATTFSYAGVRTTNRTSYIATVTSNATPVTTTETRDAMGRLTGIVENAGTTASQLTTYTYDVGDRLISVCANKIGSVCGQPRTFSYDGRGFRGAEMHPESGTTSYSNFDARGHATQSDSAAGKTLTFSYDFAERLTKVSDGVGSNAPPLKSFSFYEDNIASSPGIAADLRLGKLKNAVRYNWFGTTVVQVTETHAYTHPSGQLSARTTQIASNTGAGYVPVQKLSVAMNYDPLLLPSVVVMPTCSATDGCGAAAGLSSVGYSRQKGMLTSVTNFAALTYHPSGMVNEVKHVLPSTVPQLVDTYGSKFDLPRPSEIKFGGSSSCSAPAAPGIDGPGSVVAGSTNTFNAVSAAAGVTFTWEVNKNGSITYPIGPSVSVTAPSTGSSLTLKLILHHSCGNSEVTKSIAIGCASPAAPVITVDGSPAQGLSLAAGSTHTFGIVNDPSITSYQWSASNNTTGSAATFPFTAPANGTATVTVNVGNGCGSGTPASVVMPITCTLPAHRQISGNSTVSANTTTNEASVTGDGTTETYEWSISAGASIITNPTLSNITYSVQDQQSVTLTVVVRNACGPKVFTMEVQVTVPSCSAPLSPTITALPTVMAGGDINASVDNAGLKGYSTSWTASGGATPTSIVGDGVKFTAPASGTVTLSATSRRTCSETPSPAATKTIQVCPATTDPVISAPASVNAGPVPQMASVSARPGMSYHWTISGGTLTSAADGNWVTFTSTTPGPLTLTVKGTAISGCVGTGEVSKPVIVIPPPPAYVTAATSINTSVTVTWPAVSGAQGYVVERVPLLGGAGTVMPTVTGTTYNDVAPASATPVAYVYYVRSVGQGGLQSGRAAGDYATTATALFAHATNVGDLIEAADVAELRRCINALNLAAGMAATFGGGPSSGDEILASDFNALVAALNAARLAFGKGPFAYLGVPAPAAGGDVLAAHVLQLRNALR